MQLGCDECQRPPLFTEPPNRPVHITARLVFITEHRRRMEVLWEFGVWRREADVLNARLHDFQASLREIARPITCDVLRLVLGGVAWLLFVVSQRCGNVECQPDDRSTLPEFETRLVEQPHMKLLCS